MTHSRTLLVLATTILASSLCNPCAAQEEETFPFTEGPVSGELGRVAGLEVPAGYGFVDQKGMPAFNKSTGNLHNPDDIGALFSMDEDSGWVVFFSFDDVGYVKDDDREDLDADELLSAFKEGDKSANPERVKRGIPELNTVGWSKEPYYDATSNNLTWGLRLSSGGEPVINHQIRYLGRRGVISVIIVDSPDAIEASMEEVGEILENFEFADGEQYSQFSSGDKVAQYGLAGLVLGGGAILAGKAGLFAVLGKYFKLIIFGIIAAVAAFGNKIKALFGGGKKAAEG